MVSSGCADFDSKEPTGVAEPDGQRRSPNPSTPGKGTNPAVNCEPVVISGETEVSVSEEGRLAAQEEGLRVVVGDAVR